MLSERQAYRWVAGELSGLPYPAARGTLEEMFGEPVARLFGPPYRGLQAAFTYWSGRLEDSLPELGL